MERPAKRQRCEDVASTTSDADVSTPDPSQVQISYERADLWFEDGNVVLVAEGAAFKVHRGVLSRNSEIFRDMFGVPQPEHGETFEGCPVVHLTDSKEDVRYMLSALCDTRNAYVAR